MSREEKAGSSSHRRNAVTAGEELEARVAQVWFWEGTFSRFGINLQRHYGQQAFQVTDLDLLALEIGPGLRPRLSIGECKSGAGKDAKPLDRMVWLRGLMSLVGAQAGELTTGVSPQLKMRDLASDLGISAQSVSDLGQREARLGIGGLADIGSQGPSMVTVLKDVQRSCSSDPDLDHAFWFLRSEAWLVDRWIALKRALSGVAYLSRRFVPDAQGDQGLALRWLLAESVIVATANILLVASAGSSMTDDVFRDHMRQTLSYGAVPPTEMHRLSRAFDRYLAGVLRGRGVSSADASEYLGAFEPTPPDYADPLIELSRRIIAEEIHARHLLRTLDLVVYEGVVRQRPVSKEAVEALETPDADSVMRLCRVVMAFLAGQFELPIAFTSAVDLERRNSRGANKDQSGSVPAEASQSLILFGPQDDDGLVAPVE